MIDVKILLLLVAILFVVIYVFSKVSKADSENFKKVIGIIMAVGGAVLGGFGFVRMSSYEYQYTKILSAIGGDKYTDYSPLAMICAGAFLLMIGLILLVVKKKKSYYWETFKIEHALTGWDLCSGFLFAYFEYFYVQRLHHKNYAWKLYIIIDSIQNMVRVINERHLWPY